MKYEIEAQYDANRPEAWDVEGRAAYDHETQFVPCRDHEAETFAVFKEQPHRPEDDRWLLVAEFPTRAQAQEWINKQS